MKAHFLSKLATAAAVAVASLLPTIAPAQAQSQADYNQAYYSQYQQYYQAQQARQSRGLFGSLFGNRQVQQVQQPQSWYQQPAERQAAPRRQAARSQSSRASQQSRPALQESRKQETRRSAPENNSNWYSSFDTAWTKAYEQGRPLVVLFVHHGCPVCDEMDRNLAQPGAMDTLQSAVKARVEFTENPAVVNRFGVKLTPTFLVLTPQGAEAYREVGALSVDRLRQIQPAIDSLVAAPPADAKPSRQVGSAKAPTADEATSHTVASL